LFDTEYKMDAPLDDKFMEGQLASLEEQLSNLAREVEVNPSDPTGSLKRLGAPLATIHRLANWRDVAFVGSLLAASIGVAAWWWSSSAPTAMTAPSDPAPLAQAAPEAVAPKDAAPTAVTLSFDLAQQLQPMTRDLAAMRQAVEQLKVTQEQLVRDNESVAKQLKANQEEMARDKKNIEQINATQIEMARESETATARLNARLEQLARVIDNASELKVPPEEPKAMPEIPVPRPRRSTDVVQTHKLAPTPQQATARPQAKKPQSSSAWPWAAR
jgi:hypothetical protein